MAAPRTVLVTGATGLLGRQVLTAFRLRNWDAKGMGHSRADGIDILKADLRDQATVAKALDEIKPSVIVHCAAQRFQDKVEQAPDEARALNVEAARSLASLAAARDIFLIYISTDYVFPGRPGDAPYEIDAPTDPFSLYGQTKLDGETAVLQEYATAGQKGSGVILRVPVLYGHSEMPSESAINRLMEVVWTAQTEGAKVKMDHLTIRYPTNTEDVGRICHDVANKYLACGDRSALPRILQFSSEDKMTRYEICQLFGRIMDLSTATIEPELKGICHHPKDTRTSAESDGRGDGNDEGDEGNGGEKRPFDWHLSTRALKQLGIDIGTCDFEAWWRREVRAFGN